MMEGAADGLARAKQYMELTGEGIDPVTSANRHLPAEALFGMTLGSNWNCEDAVTESNSDTLNQFVDYEDYLRDVLPERRPLVCPSIGQTRLDCGNH